MTALGAPPTCWWCGAVAGSREHKFKQSELRLSHGRGPWRGDAEVLHGSGDSKPRTVQGPDARVLKFSPSMCELCNRTRSQPFDLAYDVFIAYLAENERKIARHRQFRFSEIFGASWPESRANLIKYWAKHMCCRAVETGLTVPNALVAYLDGAVAGAPPHLDVALVVQTDTLRLRLFEDYPYSSAFGDAELLARDGEIVGFVSHLQWGWLQVIYRYDTLNDYGSTNFEGDLVEMAWWSLVSAEYTLDPTDLYSSDLMADRRANGPIPDYQPILEALLDNS